MPATRPLNAIRAVVRGRVQGVGFRYFVVREAALLGITGFVRNMERGDGVEVVAQGDAPSVDVLVTRLRAGPAGSQVTEVTVHRIETAPERAGFTIHY
jgi:acylphosphatase